MDALSQLDGNETIKRQLRRMCQHNQIPQLLLFAGPKSAQKEKFAEYFAQLLLGSASTKNPDILLFKPEGKLGMHSIESMRSLSEQVYLPPYTGTRKVCILQDAERMLAYSSNALLKTFEEPAPHTFLILCTDKPDSLLPTILSRCFVLRFQSAQQEELPSRSSTEDYLLKILAASATLSYGEILEIAKNLTELIESKTNELAEFSRESLKKQYVSELSALQQQTLDAEVEAIQALALMTEAKILFNTVLNWYRDMHLLHVQGNKKYLIYPDMAEACFQALQKGKFLPIEPLQNTIAQAILFLERSGSLTHCLENFLCRVFT